MKTTPPGSTLHDAFHHEEGPASSLVTAVGSWSHTGVSENQTTPEYGKESIRNEQETGMPKK
jgi:hypothetical protein